MLQATSSAGPIRVGVITDQTGPLSFMGIANANVARMVIDDINARGGLLGRQVDLYLEDSETTDSAAEAAATKVEPLIPWLMEQTGAKKFYLPSADYIWPHVLNEKVRQVVTACGGAIVGEEYYALDHTEYGETVERIMSSGAEVVFNTIVPPGLTPFLERLHDAGFASRGGHLVCTYFDENFLNLVPAEHVEGLYSCLDYYEEVDDPFSKALFARYNELFPGSAKFTAGSACSGMYRGLRLWEAAVTEAGSLEQEDVIDALDHAKIPRGPGGPAEMVPGQHHVRMNMYIAEAHDGVFKVVTDLGVIDPNESEVGSARQANAVTA